MEIVDGIELNSPGDPAPWGVREQSALRQIILRTKDLADQGHNPATGTAPISVTAQQVISLLIGAGLDIDSEGNLTLSDGYKSKGDHKVNVSMSDGSWLETLLEFIEAEYKFRFGNNSFDLNLFYSDGNTDHSRMGSGGFWNYDNLEKTQLYRKGLLYWNESLPGNIISFEGKLRGEKLVYNSSSQLEVGLAEQDIDAPQFGQVKSYADSVFYRSGYINAGPTLVFTKANRTLAVTNPESSIFVKNIKTTIPLSDSKSITDTEGYWYFYYNESGELVSTQSKPSNFYFEFTSVAILYWNAVDKEAEVLIPAWYLCQYAAKGERYVGRNTTRKVYGGLGLDPTGLITDKAQNAMTDADITFAVNNGTTVDGTNLSFVSAFSVKPATFPVGYLSGAQANPVIRTKVTDTIPLMVNTGTASVQYNPISGGNFVLADVPSGSFVLYTYFQLDTMPSDGIAPFPVVFGVPGQQLYASVLDARNAAETELSRLLGYEVIKEHAVPLFTLIVESATANTNTYNCRYRTVDGVSQAYIDWRRVKGGGGVSGVAVLSHEALNDLYGGEPLAHYHLTASQHSLLTGGAETTLHKHGLQQVMDTSNSFEKIGSSSSQRFYRANGTVSVKTPVLLGQEPMKIEAYTYGTTGYSATAQGKIAFWSTENNTDTAKGIEYRIYVTKNGTIDMLCPIRVRHNGVMEYYTSTGSMVVTRADRFNNGVKTIPAIEDIVWATLTGLTVGTDTEILATDSILSAFAKAQAQIDRKAQSLYPTYGTNFSGNRAHIKQGVSYGATNAGITIQAPTAIVGTITSGVEATTTITVNIPDNANNPDREVVIDSILRDYDGGIGTQTLNILRSGSVNYTVELYVKELVNTSGIPLVINIGTGVKLYYENKSTNITFSGVVANVSNKYWSKNPVIFEVADNSITNSKLSNMANRTIKARNSSGIGSPEDMSLSTVLDWLGNANGDIAVRGSSGWSVIHKGLPGQYLQVGSDSLLKWAPLIDPDSGISGRVALCDVALTVDNAGSSFESNFGNPAYGAWALSSQSFTAKTIQFCIGNSVGGTPTYNYRIFEISSVDATSQTGVLMAKGTFQTPANKKGVVTVPVTFEVTKGKFYVPIVFCSSGAQFLYLQGRTTYGIAFAFGSNADPATQDIGSSYTLTVQDGVTKPRIWFSIEG